MADIEYSSNYAIYLTKNGIRFLTNDVSISIMDLLSNKAMTATDISHEMNISKSSVQSNMSKLSRIGFVTTYNDNSDGRKVYYVPSSTKVIEGMDSVPITDDVKERVIKQLIGDDDIYKRSIELASVQTARSGLNINPLLERLGSVVAFYVAGSFKDKTEEDAKYIASKIALMMGAKNCDIAIDTDIHVFLTNSYDDELSTAIAHMVGGMVCKIASLYKKKMYIIKSIQYSDNKKTMEIVVGRYEGNIKISAGVNKLNDGLSSFTTKDRWPFSIYSVGEKSVLFGNETQISILHALEKSDMTLKELSEKLDILPVTVHVNMAKLINIGTVNANGDTKMKNTKYSLSATPIITAEECDVSATKMVKALFDNISIDEPVFRIALGYILLTFRATGIGIKNLLYYSGSEIAKIQVQDNNDLSAEEMLDNVCNTDIMGTKLNIESKIPLVFSLPNNHSLNDLAFASPFFAGMLKTGLKLKTGHEYPIIFKNSNGTQEF